jgi:hypothetical protein
MMPRHAALRIAAIGLVLLPSAACYGYHPVPVSGLRSGMDIRVRLSGDGARRAEERSGGAAGIERDAVVSGVVGRTGSDSLLLAIPSTVYEGDFRAKTLTREVELARRDMSGVEVRRLDRWKSALVAGGVGVATFLLLRQARRGAGSSGSTPIPGGPPEMRSPRGINLTLPW